MARISLVLDTRKGSKSSKTGLYPIVLKIFHKKTAMVRLGVFTSINGWNKQNGQLRNSVQANNSQNYKKINVELNEKFYLAKKLLAEIGQSVNSIDIDQLVSYVKEVLDTESETEIKRRIANNISLVTWGSTLIKRKKDANKPGTAKWYSSAIEAVKKFNNDQDPILFEINVTFLKNFEAYSLRKNNTKNTISAYLRALRAIYNSAIDEDQFVPIKNPFTSYQIPVGGRTKKRAISKEKFIRIRKLSYKRESALWHARNYALIMFNCMGMNFIDLVQLKVRDIKGNHIHYGRSKTDDPFCIQMGEELQKLIFYYLEGKESHEYLFPTNYDGSSKHFQKYHTQRRRMNQRLRIIASDAGIDEKLTTYSIRHSWATTAKYLGISTEIISEALGHKSLKTTEIYLKSFTNQTLIKANEMVTS